MLKSACFYLSAISFAGLPLHADQPLTSHVGEHIGWTSMFSLPQHEIDQHFAHVKEEVDYRWDLLTDAYDFPPYSPNREDDSLVSEFYQFSNLRIQLWLENHYSFPCQSNSLFKISQAHLLNHRFRQPNCITFEHSATDPSYNSTSLSLGKRRFFALEGPVEEHIPHFFRLLTNWNVAYVVCLTDETDALGTPKCYPYWNNHAIQSENGEFLQITIDGAYEQPFTSWGKKDLPYLHWRNWEDHHGVKSEELVQAVNRVRKQTYENEIIAVHCSAGVGRTGTFISAICLLDAIDEQLSSGISPKDVQVNISKLFLYLNFHRPWLVAKPSQYLTLYKMVEWYLAQQEGE